jgi:Ca2+-binding EF-hand superfamily protein
MQIMARVDKNKDGKLDEDEFCELFAEEMRHLSVIRCAREKFDELDVDKTGFLEPAQIAKVVDWIVMMEHVPADHVDESKKKLMYRINAVDHDHDGKVLTPTNADDEHRQTPSHIPMHRCTHYDDTI